MKIAVLKATAVALLLSATAPTLAQSVPPVPPLTPMPPAPHVKINSGHPRMFVELSPQGREIMREAMKAGYDRDSKKAIKAARDRVLALIAADKLDVAAIRKAQAEERNLVMQKHARSQEAMLNAYQRLSLADRKAFAESMRDREDRMADHLKQARERIEQMEKRMRERMEARDREGASNEILLPISQQSAAVL